MKKPKPPIKDVGGAASFLGRKTAVGPQNYPRRRLHGWRSLSNRASAPTAFTEKRRHRGVSGERFPRAVGFLAMFASRGYCGHTLCLRGVACQCTRGERVASPVGIKLSIITRHKLSQNCNQHQPKNTATRPLPSHLNNLFIPFQFAIGRSSAACAKFAHTESSSNSCSVNIFLRCLEITLRSTSKSAAIFFEIPKCFHRNISQIKSKAKKERGNSKTRSHLRSLLPLTQPPIHSCLPSPITPKTAMGEGLILPIFIPKNPRHKPPYTSPTWSNKFRANKGVKLFKMSECLCRFFKTATTGEITRITGRKGILV